MESAKVMGLSLIFGPVYWFHSTIKDKVSVPSQEIQATSKQMITVLVIIVACLSILITVVRVRARRRG